MTKGSPEKNGNDYSAKMKPSQKQIDFAMAIGEELGIDPPFGGDRDDYRLFISDYADEFYREKNKRRYASEMCFQLDHQWSLEEFNNEILSINPKTI